MRQLLFFISTFWAVSCYTQTETKSQIIPIPFSTSTEDYAPVVREIIEAHPQGNIILQFEEGVYKFYPEKAKGKYIRISNNDNGNKRIVFDLEGLNNVRITGRNSTFLLHGKLVPFYLSGTSNVAISGINIDYDLPFIFEGKVIANNPAEKTFDVKVHPENPYEIKGNRFLFKGYDWKSDLGENIVFDPVTKRPIYFTAKYEHQDGKQLLQAEELEPGIVRFSQLVAQDVPPVGSIYTDKGPHGKNREIPAFIVQRSRNIKLAYIQVFRTGAMALIAEKSQDITLDAFDVLLKKGSDRMLSSSADATHFINCKGLISMQHCKFESMLDDATNIHGTYMHVDKVLDRHRFGAVFGHYQQEGFDFGEVGDSILFVDRGSLMTAAKGVIKELKKINDNYYIIETDQDLSRMENAENLAIDNISYYANVHIDQCSVKNNRARSLLISTPGNVLIENSYFASMMAGIRICGDANYWFESGATKQVTVRNNTFENLGIGGHAPQAILQIDPIIPKDQRGKGVYHGTILFEKNKINTFDNQVIYALSVDSLIIRDNVFTDSRAYTPIFTDLSTIDVQYCNDLILENNDFSNWKDEVSLSLLHTKKIKEKRNGKIKRVQNPNKYFYQN